MNAKRKAPKLTPEGYRVLEGEPPKPVEVEAAKLDRKAAARELRDMLICVGLSFERRRRVDVLLNILCGPEDDE